MRVLVLVEPYERSASTRFRVRHYLPGLKAAGIDTTVLPATGGRGVGKLAHWVKLTQQALRSDVMVIQRHLYSEHTLDRLRRIGRPIVYDYDDALYSFPTGQTEVPSPTWLSTVRARLHHTFRQSAHVIGGNQELAAYARQFSDSVSAIPTCVPRGDGGGPARRDNAIPVVGWIGRSENLAYIRPIAAALIELQRSRPFVLRIVCDAPLEIDGLAIENRRWSADSDADNIASFDLGISPLIDDTWSRGKCGFRAIQMMAVAAPVVVSPVGVHRELVVDGVNGFWANSLADWEDRISRLLNDNELRRRLGGAARQTIAEDYSIETHLPRLAQILRSAAQDGRA